MPPGKDWSKTWTFYEGDWHEGNVPIMGVRDHAAWLCSSVFDGARTFEGVSPDLDLHCARVNASAETMHLKPVVSAEKWLGLTQDGIKRFATDAALYIRPMYWAERSGALLVRARSGNRLNGVSVFTKRRCAAGRVFDHAVALSQAKS